MPHEPPLEGWGGAIRVASRPPLGLATGCPFGFAFAFGSCAFTFGAAFVAAARSESRRDQKDVSSFMYSPWADCQRGSTSGENGL